MARLPNRMAAAKAPSRTTRRPHRKSRNGCRECKARHMKCDQHHPTCINCSIADRQCSYVCQRLSESTAALLRNGLRPGSPASSSTSAASFSPTGLTPASLASASTSSASVTPASLASENLTRASLTPGPESASPGSGAATPANVPAAVATSAVCEDGSASSGLPAHVFNLQHLILLHHLHTGMMRPPQICLVADGQDAAPFLESVFQAAVAAPYLMDELLAFAALHLSTLQAGAAERQRYHHQATQLQTRALSLCNTARPDVRGEDCMPMFLFSSILGLHMFFNVVASREGFTEFEFLDKFVHYLRLHHGVRSITRQGWHIIRHSKIQSIIDQIEVVGRRPPHLADAQSECDRLAGLLERSREGLGAGPTATCLEAFGLFRWVLGQYHALPGPTKTHIVMAWPVRISTEFIDLIEQRRPEALVILAHWAVLLHYNRGFWVFGDAGRFVIEFIGRYLGSYWDSWMTWPQRVLDAAC